MTHLLDTSALLSHYLGEPGAEVVQAIFEDDSNTPGTLILALFEFELRLHLLGLDIKSRAREMARLRELMVAIVDVNEDVRSEAIRLRLLSSERIATIDILIAATARLNDAILVHRDPHFRNLPATEVRQIVLPPKRELPDR